MHLAYVTVWILGPVWAVRSTMEMPQRAEESQVAYELAFKASIEAAKAAERPKFCFTIVHVDSTVSWPAYDSLAIFKQSRGSCWKFTFRCIDASRKQFI